MIKNEPHHIIAIGASAGGLEEINAFFDHTPLDGVSYIIVQHLSPDFKSRMVELLKKHSKLNVLQAENEMLVQSNEVYLIPNDKFMTIKDSKLYLTAKNKAQGPHLTINTFFNSLALNSGRKGIGVILSGLGADGSEGIIAIKKAGGMVIARDPATSDFSSMPTNAIATGAVDYILEPELMPITIEDYVKHENELISDNKNDLTNTNAIVNLIKAQSPLDFSEYKQTTILRRIKRRAAFNNHLSLESYLEFLKTSPEEVAALSKDFLISVTSFFRDKEAFDFINDNVIPEIIKNTLPKEEIKFWIAGCATGEEAYSLAILLYEHLEGNDIVVKIFATDIDMIALVHAGKGLYNADITKSVSAERLEKYFTKEGDYYKVNSAIRKMIIFAQHDLVKNPPYCNMNFISCRNMLIYMTPVLQKKIYKMLLFGLKTDGYLFLGPSENPIPIMQSLSVENKKWKIFRNIEKKQVPLFDVFSLPELIENNTTAQSSKENFKNKTSSNITEVINEALLRELNYLAVCIDKKYQVIKFYGDTSKFLLQKNFNLNLEELMPKPLVAVFKTLVVNALKNNEKVSINGIRIKVNEDIISVCIAVTPLTLKKGEEQLLLVTFKEDKLATPAVKSEVLFDENKYHDEYIVNLEEELKELREKLNNAYEKLDASNENMQSFNEELLSANEEMQSTNEEMQSINEELHTVNSDYQLKNKELIEINDDLNNYFRSNINGQLFVNNDLLLMKFSPGTVKQINLLPTDIGRPLSNLSTNIKFETIINDIKEVIKKGSIITKEIESNNGKLYQIMTMPYIQHSDKKNGAIITFNDITQLKKTQLELDKKNKSLLRINADLDNFVHTASHDLLAPLGNIEISIDVMNSVKVTDPELNKFLSIINTSVKKFRALITEIATIAKVENDMITMEMVNVEEIINNIEWSLDDKIKNSGAVINTNLQVKSILFSKKNLRSILYNLISNSIKFRRDVSPIINIATIKDKENMILTIEDNGIGIDKADIEKIFDIYGRLHKEVEGQGIGLYLAKKIVDAASGNIIVESEPGKGSKFSIFLKTEQNT